MFVEARSKILRFAFQFGGYRLTRAMTKREPRVLMYHRFSDAPAPGSVSAAAFEKQVRFIKKNFRAVTMSQLARERFENSSFAANTVAITVDDGYRDFYSVAWPILKKHGIPATFYVTTGFVNGDLWLWPDQLRWLIAKKPLEFFEALKALAPETAVGDTATDRTYWLANAHLLKLDDASKHEFIQKLADSMNVQLPKAAPPEFAAVNWEELREMQAGGIEVGGHTVSHPSLARVPLEQAEAEITGCHAALERELSVGERSFCYPNGTVEDFVSSHVEMIKRCGFSCAPVAFADSQGASQRYAMRRFGPSESWGGFLKIINGAETLQHRICGSHYPTPY